MQDKQITEEQAFDRLSRLCARSEHCSKEMTDKMRLWNLTEAQQARVMERLTKYQYVDDERYTELFIRDKIKFNGWGRNKVAQALYMKGISEQMARPYLDEVSEDDYLRVLRPLVRSKLPKIKAKNSYERRAKMLRYGISRGFSIDQIKRCMDEITDETED